MRRRLFNLLALGSLLMFGIVVLFWLRSYSRRDLLHWDDEPRNFHIQSEDGRLFLMASNCYPGTSPPESGWQGNFWPFVSSQRDLDSQGIDMLGTFWIRPIPRFHFYHDQWNDNGKKTFELDVITPHWFPAFISSILPLIFFYRRIRKRNHNPFACISCGYDLRATPDRCPECGAVPSRKLA